MLKHELIIRSGMHVSWLFPCVMAGSAATNCVPMKLH